jgi:phage protein D/phage baseplate assembly protein gpV
MAITTDKKPLDSLYKAVSFQIKIDKKPLDSSYEVNKVIAFKEINKLGRARIHILGGDYTTNSFVESESEVFDPGNEVEIKLGYDQKYTLVFQGIILKHSISVKEGYLRKKTRSQLIIECVDKAVVLKNSFTNTIYREKTDNQIMSNLINQVDGLTSAIETTDYEHSVLPKYNISDWDFVLERAKYNGLLVLNSNNKISIKNPSVSSITPEVTLLNGAGTISFEAHLNSTNQFNSIKLQSRDSFNDEVFNKVGSPPDEIVTNETDNAKSISKNTSPSEVEINLPQDVDSNELKVLADSLIKLSRLQRVSGRVKFKGVLDIDLDSVVALSGFGKRFDGNVYVSGLYHEIEEGKIFTEIEFGLEENFFNPKEIFDVNQITKDISGLHIGEVTQINNDPKNQNKIKVVIPVLNDQGDGIWASLTHAYTGDESGAFVIPEVGSQVVVSFIAENLKHPVVLGCLYTSTKKPYTSTEEENNLKAFVTRSKMKIEFNEEEKEISISTPEGNSIVLNENKQEILIEDQNDNQIKTSSSGIELKSKKDIKITSGGSLQLSAQGKVDISSTADLSVKGLNINQEADVGFSAKATANLELNSSGVAVLKGSIIQIN